MAELLVAGSSRTAGNRGKSRGERVAELLVAGLFARQVVGESPGERTAELLVIGV